MVIPALLISFTAGAQERNVPDTVAGIPVNYDPACIGEYTLPGLLVTGSGEKVHSAEAWMQMRRAEILELFREYQFGHAPGRPEDLRFEVFEEGASAFDGKALRRQVTVYFTGEEEGPKMDLLVYLPANRQGPVPLLLYLSFTANWSMFDDPGIKRGMVWNRDQEKVPAPERSPFGRFDIIPFLESGFGFASVYYGDIEPDFAERIRYGIRSVYLEPGREQTADNAWGAIGAWAWGLSRAMDYFETDPDVQASQIAILGASRLGKTVLWAGARDPRFALVIASCSGEGGAALSRRNFGETIAHLTAPTRYPYQFCPNYGKFAGRVHAFPVDAHMLISLMAPRPLLLQTGRTDLWSDPEGEYLAALAASPVYRLFGETGITEEAIPEPGRFINRIPGYYMHEGGHGFAKEDFSIFLAYLKDHLQTE